MRATGLAALTLFGVTVGAGALAALGYGAHDPGRLPPLGERAYLVDEQHPDAPVTIERESQAAAKAPAADAALLKDPLQPGQVRTPKPAPVARKKPQPAPRPVMKTAQLRFRTLDIDGHLRQPRVEFSRDILPLDRADEPVSQDFYPRVFAPVRDDRF